jgi:hypothetical protein
VAVAGRALADLEAALEAAGYDVDPSMLPALKARISAL